MKPRGGNQAGYTLPEVIIASGIAAFLAASLTSVVFVAFSANTTWNPRLQASGQIRKFQQSITDDQALGALPQLVSANPCPGVSPAPSNPIVLRGVSQTNPSPPPATLSATQVAYWWDGVKLIYRCAGGKGASIVARNVTAFSWSIDHSNGSVLVVSMTATDAAVTPTYIQSQTLRFEPHRDTP
jgi:prepilin-type N-terminal cleavage/methylation domain-containing protein